MSRSFVSFIGRGRCILLLAALLPFFSTGCLTFERQRSVIGFNTAKDEVQMLFVYEGLHSTPFGDGIETAKKKLTELVKDNTVFYLGLDLLRISKTNASKESKELGKLLKESVAIAPGEFLKDDAGAYSYYHTITITKASKFFPALNKLISAGIEKEFTESLKEKARKL